MKVSDELAGSIDARVKEWVESYFRASTPHSLAEAAREQFNNAAFDHAIVIIQRGDFTYTYEIEAPEGFANSKVEEIEDWEASLRAGWRVRRGGRITHDIHLTGEGSVKREKSGGD